MQNFFFQIKDTSCDYGLFSPIINQTRFLKNFDSRKFVCAKFSKAGYSRTTKVSARKRKFLDLIKLLNVKLAEIIIKGF